MHRGFYVATVLVPLVLGSSFLIFGIFTDYWSSLDYSKIKNFPPNSFNTDTYNLKKIRFEFPKFSSLFDECNEYKIIEVLDPIEVDSLKSSNIGSLQGIENILNDNLTTHNQVFQPTEVLNDNNELTSLDNNQNIQENKDKNEQCLTREECNNLNPNENGSCFCCKKNTLSGETECCHPRSTLCDGVRNCMGGSDELENCPLKKVFYSHSWYDNKHKCQRNQFNFFSFLRKALDLNERFNSKSTDNFCLSEILKSENFTIRIFLLRLLTLIGFGFCLLFTILCLITVLFVTCCHNLRDQPKSGSQADIGLYGESEEDDFESGSKKNICCKCNCLLCPFVFFSTFSILAFVFHLFGLIVYVYSICYTRNAHLIFDSGYQPPLITKAYQYNPWLFSVQEFGVSFYSILISFVLYMIMFICSTCITCRIQMSPAWVSRNTSSYEVLQMNDIVYNNKKLEKAEAKKAKKFKKKEKKEKSVDVENVDEFSDHSGTERQALTRPKTNIQAIDNSYE